MDGGLTALVGAASALVGALTLRLFDWFTGRGQRKLDVGQRLFDQATEISDQLRADLTAARQEVEKLRTALAEANGAMTALRRDYDSLHAEFELFKFKHGLNITLNDNAPPPSPGTGTA